MHENDKINKQAKQRKAKQSKRNETKRNQNEQEKTQNDIKLKMERTMKMTNKITIKHK